jgi:hypothetical protein
MNPEIKELLRANLTQEFVASMRQDQAIAHVPLQVEFYNIIQIRKARVEREKQAFIAIQSGSKVLEEY